MFALCNSERSFVFLSALFVIPSAPFVILSAPFVILSVSEGSEYTP